MSFELPWITPGFDDKTNLVLNGPQKPDGITYFAGRRAEVFRVVPISSKSNKSDESFDIVRAAKGGKNVAKGIAILMVPDPLPLIDEIYAISLIGWGTYQIATA